MHVPVKSFGGSCEREMANRVARNSGPKCFYIGLICLRVIANRAIASA